MFPIVGLDGGGQAEVGRVGEDGVQAGQAGQVGVPANQIGAQAGQVQVGGQHVPQVTVAGLLQKTPLERMQDDAIYIAHHQATTKLFNILQIKSNFIPTPLSMSKEFIVDRESEKSPLFFKTSATFAYCSQARGCVIFFNQGITEQQRKILYSVACQVEIFNSVFELIKDALPNHDFIFNMCFDKNLGRVFQLMGLSEDTIVLRLKKETPSSRSQFLYNASMIQLQMLKFDFLISPNITPYYIKQFLTEIPQILTVGGSVGGAEVEPPPQPPREPSRSPEPPQPEDEADDSPSEIDSLASSEDESEPAEPQVPIVVENVQNFEPVIKVNEPPPNRQMKPPESLPSSSSASSRGYFKPKSVATELGEIGMIVHPKTTFSETGVTEKFSKLKCKSLKRTNSSSTLSGISDDEEYVFDEFLGEAYDEDEPIIPFTEPPTPSTSTSAQTTTQVDSLSAICSDIRKNRKNITCYLNEDGQRVYTLYYLQVWMECMITKIHQFPENLQSVQRMLNDYEDLHPEIPKYVEEMGYKRGEVDSAFKALHEVEQDPENRLKQAGFLFVISNLLQLTINE